MEIVIGIDSKSMMEGLQQKTVIKNNLASGNKNFELKKFINRRLFFYEHIGHEQVYIRCCRVNFSRQKVPV